MRIQSQQQSYRMHNAERGIVVESRNVTFIETPQGVRRMQEDETHHDELAGRTCTNDIMDYTSFLGPLMLGSSGGASRDEVEKLCVKRSRSWCLRTWLKASPRRKVEHPMRKHRLRPPGSPVA